MRQRIGLLLVLVMVVSALVGCGHKSVGVEHSGNTVMNAGTAEVGTADQGTIEESISPTEVGSQPSSAGKENVTEQTMATQSNATQSNGTQSNATQSNGTQSNGTQSSETQSSTTQRTEATSTTTPTTTQQNEITKPVVVEFESANKAVANMKIGYNIGNSLDSTAEWIKNGSVQDYETAWGNPVITKGFVQSIKAQGFNTIRLPVSYVDHIDENGKIDEEWLARVKEVVDYILEQDMYCIINIHHDTGEGQRCWLKADANAYNNTNMAQKFKYMWVQIAEYFKEYDQHLLFEGFNEMLDGAGTWENPNSSVYPVVNSLNQLFVDTVRATGGNNATRNLIVNPYSASWHEPQANGFVLPKDSAENHLIIEVHFYDPYLFCSCQDQTFSDYYKSQVEKAFVDINNISVKWKVPVIIGEFGAKDANNSEYYRGERGKFVTAVMENAGKYGIVCIWWDNGADYGILDRNTGAVTDNIVINALFGR